MSKKIFLALVPFLVFGMSACQRGNGGASSGGGTSSGGGASGESSQTSGDQSSGDESSEEESSQEAASGQTDPIEEGYSVKVGDNYYALVEGTPEYPNQTLYASVLVTAEAGDSVSFYKDGGEALSFWSDGASTENNTYPASPFTAVQTSVEIAVAGDVTIYLKQYDDQTTEYCMWISGNEAGGGSESGGSEDVPEGETQFTWTVEWVWNDDVAVFGWAWGGSKGDGAWVAVTKTGTKSGSVNLGDAAGICFGRFPAGTTIDSVAWSMKYNQSQNADMTAHTVAW